MEGLDPQRSIHEQVRDLYLDKMMLMVTQSRFRGRVAFRLHEDFLLGTYGDTGADGILHILKAEPMDLWRVLESARPYESIVIYI